MRARSLIFITISALVGGAVLIAFFFRPIANQAAAAWLSGVGFSSFHFGNSSLGLKRVVFQDLNASYSSATGTFQFAFPRVTITYDLLSLFRNENAPSIVVDGGEIIFARSPPALHQGSHGSLAASLADLQKSLPLSRLSANAIRLIGVAPVELTVSAALEKNDSLSLSANFSSAGYGTGEFSLKSRNETILLSSTGSLSLPSAPAVSWKLLGALEVNQINFLEDSSLSAATHSFPSGTLHPLTLNFQSGSALDLTKRTFLGHLRSTDVVFETPSLSLKAVGPTWDGTVTVSDKGIEVLSSASSTALSISSGDYQSPGFIVEGTLESDLEGLRASFDGSLPGQPHLISLRSYIDPDTNKGLVTLAVPSLTLSQNASLSSLHPSWSLPFDVNSGLVSLKAVFPLLASDEVPHFDVSLTNATLTTSKAKISGLTTKGTFNLAPSLQTARPLQITAEEIAAAIPLSRATAELTLRAGSLITVPRASGTVLGGVATFSNFSADPARGTFNTDFSVTELPLENVMALYPQTTVEASGSLNFSGSMGLKDGKLSGQVFSLHSGPGGGLIKYNPGADSNADSRLMLVAGALRNFHYKELTGTGTFMEDGLLNLALLLKGSNPEWQRGQPVHLNLTLSENVFELLRSIKLASGESDEISKSIRDASSR